MSIHLNPQELQALIQQLIDALLPAFEKQAKEQVKATKSILTTLTVAEVAQRLKWSEKTVLNRIEDGRLKADNVVTLGKPQYRISEADLNEFYTRHRLGSK